LLSVLAEDRSGTSAEDLEDTLDFTTERRDRRKRRARHLGMSLAGLALAAAVWEVAALIIGDTTLLPSVQATVSTFFQYIGQPYPTESDPLWQDILVSTERILVGFSFGTIAGVVLGSLMYALRPVRHLVDPIIEVTRPLPPLAFIPLLIVWFGIGELPKIVLIFIGVLPIMVIATLAALDSVPHELESCARTLGASKGYALAHVQVRAAIPGIITGMRIAMAGSWTSIVAAEMIAATSGVGYLILQAGNYLRTSLVFCGIISIGLMGLLLDGCLRLLLRWADPTRR
jgi:ABC-type nitrate/sulfonate/bicarbonate transport system permease component